MKHLKKWQHQLASSRGLISARRLTAEMEKRYRGLLHAYGHISARPLRSQLTNLILPGLALYQTLMLDLGGDREAALDESETLFRAEFFTLERRFIPLLRVLPDPFPILRHALRQMGKNTYLPRASEIVEDTANCFAVNTYRCFILDTLRETGAPELTPLYCKTDDWLAELLPGVRWLRTGTLALGADCCDFRWCRDG